MRRRLRRQADPLGLAHDLLEILRRRQPLGLGGLPRGGARALGVVERGDARLRPAPALLGLLHLELQAQDLRAEVADRALPGEERGVAAARGPPAAEGAGRAQQLAADGHEARAVTVLGVQALRRAEIAHHDDRAEQVGDQARMARGDERLRQPHHARVRADVGLRSAVQPVERQERRLPAVGAAEVAEGRLGGLERLHHHPLEPLAQRRLDGALELPRHVEEVGDRTHDPSEARLPGGREDRLHAPGVAGPLGLELLQRGPARPPRRKGHPARLRRLRGRGPLRRRRPRIRRQIPELDLERGDARRGGAHAGAGGSPGGLDAGPLGIGLDALRLEAIQPAMKVLLPLVQRAQDLPELGPVSRETHLIVAERLRRLPRPPEAHAQLVERRLLGLRPRLEGRELAPDGLEERALGAPLLGERLQPEREGLRLLAEPVDLGTQVALDQAELLGPSHAPLELELRALERVPRLGRPLLGRHHVGACQLERRPQRGHASLAHLDPRSLGRLFPAEALLLPGQRGMLGRQEGDLDRPPLGLERLVLLRLLRLALEGAELPLDLVHHVPHAEEILARRLQLAERLGPLELVPGDARRLLHEDPPVERLRGEDVGQTLLLHQRVGLRVHARAQEEIVDVLQPADRLVEEVLGLAVPVEAPSDAHLAPRHAQLAVVGEREQDLGQPERPPRGRPVEDHVLHPVAAEGLGALLAERPPERVRDVRLAAAVGTDDGGDPGKDAHVGAIREGLEAEQRHSLEPHDCQRLIARPGGPSKEKIPGVGAFAVPTPTC